MGPLSSPPLKPPFAPPKSTAGSAAAACLWRGALARYCGAGGVKSVAEMRAVVEGEWLRPPVSRLPPSIFLTIFSPNSTWADAIAISCRCPRPARQNTIPQHSITRQYLRTEVGAGRGGGCPRGSLAVGRRVWLMRMRR